MPHHSARRGFTLIELLVTIGILALLLGILLPTMSSVRRSGRLTACASNMHQICLAITSYATTNGGEYPDLTTPSTGKNLWDVSNFFTDALAQQGVKVTSFFCPLSRDFDAAVAAYNVATTWRIIEYNVWLQRSNGTDIIPPSPTYVGPRMKIVQPIPSQPFAGPANPMDTAGVRNPVITDILGSNGANPPANADATLGGNPWGWSPSSNHMENGRVKDVNAGFADGHVETRKADQVKPYYKGNWWNWR